MTSLREQLQQKIDLKTKPTGALGALEKLALRIGLWLGTTSPKLKKPCILVFAGDHGVSDEGVSAYPKDVTWQMVMNFVEGGAAINVFCRQNGLDLKVVDAGVDHEFSEDLPIVHAKVAYGTANLLEAPAMTSEQLELALATGARLAQELSEQGCNCLGLGEMGIGNTSSAALLMHRYLDLPLEQCVGSGTGVHGEALQHKLAILHRAAGQHDPQNPDQILQTFGGFEIAMMTGAMLEAWRLRMLILVDGFISTSALLAAWKMEPQILEACLFSHCSDEAGHQLMLDALEVDPILKLGLRLGEGSGAAVAFPIVKSALSFLAEMSSFEDAGVSNKANVSEKV